MTKAIGCLAAMIVLIAAALPLGAGAQAPGAGAQEQAKKQAPAKAAPARPAAPAARSAPATRPAPAARAPASHPAPAARVAPARPAPQRAATPQRQAPAANRVVRQQQHQQVQSRVQTQPKVQAQRKAQAERKVQAQSKIQAQRKVQAQSKTQAQRKVQAQFKIQAQRKVQAQPKTPVATQQQQKQASPAQLQRQERALRQREDRALRATPAKQRAARREEIQRARQQRALGNQARPNALTAKPSLVPQQNARVRTDLRRNGQARVTPQAAQQGRFAARFAAQTSGTHARNRFAYVAAHRAWHEGHRAAFVSWVGPVFWPYAYSDIFDYAFWPAGYDDGYWAYAYDGFFDGVFWGEAGPPEEYAYAPTPEPTMPDASGAVPSAEATMPATYGAAPSAQNPATRAAVQEAQELCKQPGSGITAWPFAEIEEKVGLNAEQTQLLGDVKTAGAKAASAFKASCPSENAFPLTPPGRLGAMTARLDATLEAVQAVRPALEKFYDSLSDEQKERFNAIGPQLPKDNAAASQAAAPEAQSCKEQKPGLTNLPIEKIDDVVKPTDAQVEDLNKLEDATTKAVSIMQAACPEDTPITPPGRLAAMEARLQAMIDAAKTVKPALDSFYGSLNAEQKARFNRIGRELAQTTGQSNK